ncbi:cysteine--tRNA ligase [Acinetobacter sp. ANC 4204]|uniref:cysteine--tRNA ligase n=1 Tax=Acinetobacter sp. ANC 4204 TaxID=1977884 RepID=UPI000A3459E6|nr:cysteine--tRNA ligase [Acinetobacter sp. ANC 4204]OTG58798.1 cysteine--tRNA ligase [Acinetobacter sp. ANC 4204]
MSDLYVYNAETRSKEHFEPIVANEIKLYVCGITVYDYCHIGHARTMIAFDLIVRFLRSQGWKVKYIRNITDIDDKIIQKAQDNHESIGELTDRFIQSMHKDFQTLGCLSPDAEPKATDFIQYIQTIIQTLFQKKCAYQTSNGDIYFSIESYPDYGRLSGRKLADMQAGASQRINIETEKRHPFDFVLWKASKPNEPFWQSPWGNERPGWHIECSAMSMCHLGNHFDIHGGGGDLIFPHHENEIAQSEAATGEKYVNYWLHTGFINVNGEKMSKSLGNFLTIRDAFKTYHPEVIRLSMISSHYRSPIDFSDHILKDTQKVLSRFYQAIYHAQPFITSKDDAIKTELNSNPFIQKFNQAMNDDFNTPEALVICFDLLKQLNIALKEENQENVIKNYQLLLWIGNILNIFQYDPEKILKYSASEQDSPLSDQEIQEAILARNTARTNKQYALADQIRQKLLKSGILLEDTQTQTIWRLNQ